MWSDGGGRSDPSIASGQGIQAQRWRFWTNPADLKHPRLSPLRRLKVHHRFSAICSTGKGAPSFQPSLLEGSYTTGCIWAPSRVRTWSRSCIICLGELGKDSPLLGRWADSPIKNSKKFLRENRGHIEERRLSPYAPDI
jgi:hypothetical protein